MVKVKAYRGSEIRRFDIEAGATFAQLQELVVRLFGLKEDAVTINYCDTDGDMVWLLTNTELQTAFKHLGEQDTWKLQIKVQLKQEVDHRPPTQADSSWWDWNPFHIHVATRAPSQKVYLTACGIMMTISLGSDSCHLYNIDKDWLRRQKEQRWLDAM